MGITTVRFLGTFKAASRREKLDIMISKGAKISTIIGSLHEQLREELRNMLVDPALNSTFQPGLILVNGVEISNLQGIDTPIHDGDTIVFVSVTHGG